MQTLIHKLALGAAIVASATAAQAASDFLLEIEGIKGETKDRASVETFQWSQAFATEVFNPFQPALAGGVFVAAGDLDGDGTRYESLTLTATTPDGDDFYRYELKNVLVSSYSVSGGTAAQGHKEWIVIESMSGPIMRWAPPTATGGRGDWVVGSWDGDTGRFVGDAAVMGAFDDLGAVRFADGTLAITAAVPEPGSWALMLLGAAAVGTRLRQQRRSA